MFIDDDASGINTQQREKLLRRLDRLDAAKKPEDMNIPGWNFHRLTGDRHDQYSVKVTGNWRLIFEFTGGDAHSVNLEDYH